MNLFDKQVEEINFEIKELDKYNKESEMIANKLFNINTEEVFTK